MQSDIIQKKNLNTDTMFTVADNIIYDIMIYVKSLTTQIHTYIILSLFCMWAEREGFEPSIVPDYDGFQNRCFQPLSHLSFVQLYGSNWI